MISPTSGVMTTIIFSHLDSPSSTSILTPTPVWRYLLRFRLPIWENRLKMGKKSSLGFFSTSDPIFTDKIKHFRNNVDQFFIMLSRLCRLAKMIRIYMHFISPLLKYILSSFNSLVGLDETNAHR